MVDRLLLLDCVLCLRGAAGEGDAAMSPGKGERESRNAARAGWVCVLERECNGGCRAVRVAGRERASCRSQHHCGTLCGRSTLGECGASRCGLRGAQTCASARTDGRDFNRRCLRSSSWAMPSLQRSVSSLAAAAVAVGLRSGSGSGAAALVDDGSAAAGGGAARLTPIQPANSANILSACAFASALGIRLRQRTRGSPTERRRRSPGRSDSPNMAGRLKCGVRVGRFLRNCPCVLHLCCISVLH